MDDLLKLTFPRHTVVDRPPRSEARERDIQDKGRRLRARANRFWPLVDALDGRRESGDYYVNAWPLPSLLSGLPTPTNLRILRPQKMHVGTPYYMAPEVMTSAGSGKPCGETGFQCNLTTHPPSQPAILQPPNGPSSTTRYLVSRGDRVHHPLRLPSFLW